MSDLRVGREALTALALSAYRALSLPLPKEIGAVKAHQIQAYLDGNPDVTSETAAQEIEGSALAAKLHPNVVDLANLNGMSILNERVKEIETVISRFDPEGRFQRTIIGTVPGGGLDATSFAVADSHEYAVVIPDGFFHLSNLLTKLVILMQPLTPMETGPVYLPSASYDQLALLGHPYVRFRHQDLLEGFLLAGDPRAALPYMQALAYQDRFAYLLVGTELFVLAHELAHVLLGHLDAPDAAVAQDRELDADSLALEIVTAYFAETDNYPMSRASMCGFQFLSMVRMWEVCLETLTGDAAIATAHTHPISADRFDRFVQGVGDSKAEPTPSWYIFTHNAIKLVTQTMLPDALTRIKDAAPGAVLSARVLPRSYQHLGQFDSTDERRWWHKIAVLVSSADPEEHFLGLWFLDKYRPAAALGIYQGIDDEDETLSKTCETALVKLEPHYVGYFPKLRAHYRQAKLDGEFGEYLYQLSQYLGAKVASNLGESQTRDPMDPLFFTRVADPDVLK